MGPIVAAYLIGYTGDVGRFPSAGHYARYNATAPIEASSGPRVRHRLNPRGNRQLNHAMYMIAVTQVRNQTPGRAYYRRKRAEGKSRKEAMRALKRRISDVVYRRLVADANCAMAVREDIRDDSQVQRDRLSTLTAGSSD